MPESSPPSAPLEELKQNERAIVLSFLELSEKRSPHETDPIEELALSLALKSSLNSEKN